jgi:uncharacterized membrane protein HdeD (DUF308 family)
MEKLKTWWLIFTAGVILFVIGVYSWMAPLSAYYKLAKYSGFVLLINGLLLIWASANPKISVREKKWLSAESIAGFFFGILLIISPILSFIVFPILIGHWILCMGILKILGSVSLRKDIRGWVFILLTGILSVIFGILIAYISFPKANDITLLIGAFGVMTGLLDIIDSFRFRKMDGTLNMML